LTAASINQPLMSTAELQAMQQLVRPGRRPHRRLSSGLAAGDQRSARRGAGLEFSELRPYQIGDDWRTIDWRATARNTRPMTKIYEEQRTRITAIVVDRGTTMHFGTRSMIKAALGARIAALFTFSSLAQRDAVCGMIYDPRISYFAPSQRLAPTLRFLHAVCAPLKTAAVPVSQRTGDTPYFLEQPVHALPAGARIVLVSDFAGLNEEHLEQLLRLRIGREVIAVQVTDPAEEQLADVGLLRIRGPNGQHHVVIDTSDGELREQYARAMTEHQERLAFVFHSAAIRHVLIHTNEDPAPVLQPLL